MSDWELRIAVLVTAISLGAAVFVLLELDARRFSRRQG